jgi:hypothetical protein
LASNRLPACSTNSFFQSPTWVGCTPNSWAISFTVFTPRIASKATFALNSPLNTLRFFSLTTDSSFPPVTILNDCLEIGVHYNAGAARRASRGGLDED